MGTRLPFHGAMAQELLTENGLCVMAAGLGLNQARYPFVAVPLRTFLRSGGCVTLGLLWPRGYGPQRRSMILHLSPNHGLASSHTHPRVAHDD